MPQTRRHRDRHAPADGVIRRLTALGVVMLALLAGTGAALAAETPDAAEDEAASQPDETRQDASTETAEVFIPTEEISEDFAVAFPVDI